MQRRGPSIIAREGERLAGYALVMAFECRSFLPILEPMFVRLDRLRIQQQRFYVMGQICVARPWRGRGIFDLLYRSHRYHLRTRYVFSVTEGSPRNTRSMRAHQRSRLPENSHYRDET